MAYHLLISSGPAPDDLLLDLYIGSARTLEHYWESVGATLNLPTIASITAKADYEPGFVLSGESLLVFGREMAVFEEHWRKVGADHLPTGFLENIGKIREGIGAAIDGGFALIIC